MIMDFLNLILMSIPVIGIISFLIALVLDEREFRNEMEEEYIKILEEYGDD